jgi:hypothetical protein
MKFGMGILFNPVSSTIPKWWTLTFTKEKKQDEARPCVRYSKTGVIPKEIHGWYA